MITDSRATQLFLVRHGESAANLRNILQGKTIDESLSDAGRRQAELASGALRSCPVRHVYSSSLRRARETAEAIARPHGLPVTPIESLHEVDVGRWAGMNWATIRREMPQAWEQYMAVHGEFPTPDGESYRDVLNRVWPILEDLLAKHDGESIVVVAHNVVNRVYLARLLGMALRQSTVIRQHNGAINLIRRDPQAHSVVVTVNSVMHLE